MKKYGLEGMVSGIIQLLIFVIVAVNLIGPVANSQAAATTNTNVSGAANSLTALITTIFVAVILVSIVRFV